MRSIEEIKIEIANYLTDRFISDHEELPDDECLEEATISRKT